MAESENKGFIIFGIVAAVVVVSNVVVYCIFLILRKIQGGKTNSLKYPEETSSTVEESSRSNEIGVEYSHMKFELTTLQNATNNFSEANKIGEEGFSVVYKGELQNGELIAVKRLYGSSTQGNLEFKNEVELIAKLQHKNLVKLLGYCHEEREMIIVYEFVPNGSLDGILFHPVNRGYLNWERRYRIIENIVRGFVYLHEDYSRHCIIHRDLRANNILLDADLNPKIAGFGMAALFASNQAQDSTNTVVRPDGYVAPEYARYGNFSERTDVYSFGVLVLEIISGQRNTVKIREFTRDLVFDVWTNWKNGCASNVIDSMILKSQSSPVHEIKRCIHVALLCVQESVADRPKMSLVLEMLSRNSAVKLSEPSNPGFFIQGSVNS